MLFIANMFDTTHILKHTEEENKIYHQHYSPSLVANCVKAFIFKVITI